MASRREVEKYLKDLKEKIRIFGILFLDERGKNAQTLADLDITPNKRIEIINELTVEDYSEGPVDEKMRNILPLWVFGKIVKKKEIYIKVSMGGHNSNAVCISFHIAQYSIDYRFKNN